MPIAPLTLPQSPRQGRASGVGKSEKKYVNALWERYAGLYRQAEHSLTPEAFAALKEALGRLANLYPTNWAQVSHAIELCERALKARP